MPAALDRLQEWLEETHGIRFELCRHFFLRFFDSDLVSTPGQFRVVAIGAFAILLSSSLIFAQAYWHKYMALEMFDTAEPYRLAVIADALFLVTLAMFVIGLFTTLQWPALFPGLGDYLALAGLPIRMRDVFVAKFTALVGFAGIFVVATTLPPSVLLTTLSSGRYAMHTGLRVPALFLACSLAALFVFFSLVAVQGVMLNLLPHRQFTRVSLTAQGALLTALLCGLPLVFWISSLTDAVRNPPGWAVWLPPAWFLAVYQTIAGNGEPMPIAAWIGPAAVAAAALAAVFTYFWSFRRHRTRLLETPASASKAESRMWTSRLTEKMLTDPPEFGVFAFISKTLARSRHHRLVLTAFTAIAIAVIFESFVSLALSRGLRALVVQSPALRGAAISAPLALSLFVLAGFRYLFRLPVELRANWIFRINEAGNRPAFLAASEQFLNCCAVAPVALVTLPLEIFVFGAGPGTFASILCLLPSMILMEALLVRFEKVPFTSSYLPGRRPLIETVLIYAIAVILYVSVLSGIISWALSGPRTTIGLFAVMLIIWWRVRRGRREDWEIGKLEFEELPETLIQTLSIQRD